MSDTFSFTAIVFAQFWQVTLLAIIAMVAARTVARNRPHLAMAIWMVVLAKCITPPIWSSPTGLFCWMHRPTTELHEIDDANTDHLSQTAYRSQRLLQFKKKGAVARTRGSDAGSIPNTGSPIVIDISNDRSPEFVETVISTSDSRLEHTAKESANSESKGVFTGFDVRPTLIVIWLTGCALAFLVSSVRCWFCLRVINRTSTVADKRIISATNRLAKKLKLRRKVKVLITESRFGPAVIGLFRPVIVIPRVILESGSIRDLEPILAHELTHIRRGDLWFGMFQLLAGVIWWFHPLMRIVNRMAIRDAERCCDEEVIGRFGYSTTEYARSLVNVLQCKQALIPAAVFPGVRPIDITTKRLERIMKLQNGCCTRAPLWCWLLMLAVSMIVLPGAAMGVATTQEKSQDDSKSKSAQSASEINAIEETDETDEKPIVEYGVEHEVEQEVEYEVEQEVEYEVDYEVGTFVRRMMKENELDLEMGQVSFILHLKAISGWPTEISSEEPVDPKAIAAVRVPSVPLESRIEMAKERSESLRALRESLARYFTWKHGGKTLAISQTAAVHNRIKRAISVIERCGFGQTTIEIRFATCTSEIYEQVGKKLIRANAESGEAKNDLDTKISRETSKIPDPNEDERDFSVRAVIEKEVPVISGSLDDEQAREIINIINSDKRSNIMFAPKVTVFDGQKATISDVVQRPFVVSMKDGDPVVRVHAEGTIINLQMFPNEKEGVDLDFKVLVSDIKNVDTFTYTDKKLGKDFTVQIPNVERASITGLAEVELGKLYLVGGLLLPPNSRRKDERLIVMFRTVKYDLDEESVAVINARNLRQTEPEASEKEVHSIVEHTVDMETLAKEPIFTRSYRIADLLEGLYPFIDATNSKTAPSGLNDEATRELVDDIASEFPAECWKKNGGKSTISFDRESKTLIVSSGESVHTWIADTLAEGREFLSDQATITVTAIRANKDGWNEIKSLLSETDVQTLSGVETFFMKQALANDKRFTVTQLPKISLLNGQMYRFSSEVLLGAEGKKFFEHAVLTADSKTGNQLSVGVAWGSAKTVDVALLELLSDVGSEEIPEDEPELEERDAELAKGQSMLLTGIGGNDHDETGTIMLLITADTAFKSQDNVETVDSDVLPSAYYLDDDVQYFPASP